MKLLFEIYRILRELGIKTKDIIGVGKSLQKTGTKLFKENIDPKILEVIYNKGTLSDKIKKIITEAAKGLRDTNPIEKRKFLVNIRQIKNAVIPQEAEVIDIATRAKIPASGIEKLKTRIQLDKNVRPFKEGEARWILEKALKEDAFAFAPEEIKMIKGGKGDILELFRKYYGSKAVRNLPADGSVLSTSRFFDQLKYAVDESGFFANHPKFNKEAIDFKKTRELVMEFGDTIEGHPFTTQSELRGAMRNKDWVSDAIKKGKLNESVPPDTKILTGKFPRLDPDNNAFIILDAKGNRMGRYEGRVSIDKKTNKGTHQWWDRWDEKNQKLLTDKSKYKFSSATDETGKEIISEVIDLKSAAPAEGITTTPQRIKQGFSTKIKLNSESENRELIKELIGRKNAEFNSLNVEQRKEILDLLDTQMKKSDFASGGRIGLRTGTAKEIINLVVKHGPAFKKFADGLFIKAFNWIQQGKGIFKNLTQSQKTKQHDNLVKAINTFEKKGTLEGTEQYFGINAEKAFIAAQAKVKKPKVKNEYYSKKEMEKEWELENKLAKQEMEQAHTFKLNKEKFMKEFPEVDAADVDILMSAEPDVQKIMIKGLYERRKDATAFDAILDSKPMKTIEDAQDAELRWQNYLMNKDKTPPTKHATGGRIGFAEGVGEMLLPKAIPKEIHHDKMLQRKEQEIAQLKEEIEKRKRGKQTILDNPGAFVDKEGRFTGEALIQSADNDIAALEKELNKYLNEERVPGHATGGVSNLFRRR